MPLISRLFFSTLISEPRVALVIRLTCDLFRIATRYTEDIERQKEICFFDITPVSIFAVAFRH